MAFSKCKGTVLSMAVSGVSTSVAQVIEITPPKSKSIDFEAETLDQSGVGVPRELTGYVDADAFSATLFWDPALASRDRRRDFNARQNNVVGYVCGLRDDHDFMDIGRAGIRRGYRDA